MLAIFKRELRSCFHGMIGAVLTAFMLAATAIYFVALNLGYGLPDFGYYTLYRTIFVLLLYIPVLAMRSFAEERHSRTDQLLLTSPVSVGGIVLSGFWSSDFPTQIPSYSLPIYFTMQNSNDTAAQLPFRGVAENGDVLDNFTIRMDGQPRNHYRLYACTHTSRFTPEEKGHLETLQPQEICFAETGISLTKDEYSTLYTTGHTLEITFSYGDESVTVRGNTRTGIFKAI